MPVPACDDTRYWLPRYDDSLGGGGQRRNNVIRRSLIILTPHILLMAPPQLQVHPAIGNSKQHPGRGTEVIINDDRWPQVWKRFFSIELAPRYPHVSQYSVIDIYIVTSRVGHWLVLAKERCMRRSDRKFIIYLNINPQEVDRRARSRICSCHTQQTNLKTNCYLVQEWIASSSPKCPFTRVNDCVDFYN